MSRKFFSCDCGCVVVEIDEDIEQTVFFTLYHRYPKWSFRYRMKAIWNILTQGKVYGDDLVMSRAVAADLAHHLWEIVKEK